MVVGILVNLLAISLHNDALKKYNKRVRKTKTYMVDFFETFTG